MSCALNRVNSLRLTTRVVVKAFLPFLGTFIAITLMVNKSVFAAVPCNTPDTTAPDPPTFVSPAFYDDLSDSVKVEIRWTKDNPNITIPPETGCPNGVGYCVGGVATGTGGSCTTKPFHYIIRTTRPGTPVALNNKNDFTTLSLECKNFRSAIITFDISAVDANGNESSPVSTSTQCLDTAPLLGSVCEELTENTWEKAPSPMAILCPLVRYLNLILYASAAVFVIMVFLSAIKYALSQGDPKALQGAKGSLTWAIIGFLVIIGVFTMLVILKNVLGLEDNVVLNPVGVLKKNLMDLFDKFGIKNY